MYSQADTDILQTKVLNFIVPFYRIIFVEVFPSFLVVCEFNSG